MNQPVFAFVDFYQQLDRHKIDRLGQIYDPQIEFGDPLHQIIGLAALERYFAKLYQNLAACRFEVISVQQQEGIAAVRWQMHYRHPKLQRGQARRLMGASFLHFTAQGKVIAQQDYYDLGAMIYEALPLFGPAIALIKGRLTGG